MKSIKLKKIGISYLFLFILVLSPNMISWAQSTRDYQISASIFSGGGGTRTSTNYQQFDVFGEPVVGLRTSGSYEENDGFIYQIGGMPPPPPDTIYVSINNTSANSGDTFLYPIYVSDTNVEPPVEGYVFTLTYDDPSILTATGFETDGTLTAGSAWMTIADTTVTGEITVTAASTGYLSGEGVLINIVFQVDSSAPPGSTSNLVITEFIFNEGNPVADLSGATAVFTVIDSDLYDISGNIAYYSNFGPVPDVTVELLPSTYLTTTIANGDYNFYDIPGSTYEITTSYDDININGINLIDYGKVKRHILGLEIIIPSSFQWMAADVNGDGNINAIDYGKIKQRILDYITEFPIGNWLFDPDSIEIELTSNLTGQDFVGIKVGDVNGDWSPSYMVKGVNSNNYNQRNNTVKSIIFTIEDTQGNLGEDVDVNVTMENFSGAAVELHIVFDDTKLTYNNFTSSYLSGSDVNVVGNQINIFKDFGSAQNITDIFITLNFTVIGDIPTELNFQNCIVLDEFYNPIPNVTYNNGVIYPGYSVYESDESQVAFLTNSPNPFKYTTSIIYYMLKPNKVKIKIYNIKGNLIETLVDEHKTTGTHSVEWDASHFTSGVYFCNISSGRNTITKRIILIK